MNDKNRILKGYSKNDIDMSLNLHTKVMAEKMIAEKKKVVRQGIYILVLIVTLIVLTRIM